MMRPLVRILFSYLLSVALAFSSPIWAQTDTRAIPETPAGASLDPLAALPFWQEISQSPLTTGPWGPFPAADPMIDDDPYFLRSQHWNREAVVAGPQVWGQPNSQGVEIQVGDSTLGLQIDQPLKPAFAVGDYLFLQAQSPDFFRAKAADQNELSEGLFFIDQRDLERSTFTNAPEPPRVPVFFIPLEGQGWTEPLSGIELADQDLISVRAPSGSSFNMDLEDLDELTKIYHFNLTLALANSLRFARDVLAQSLSAAIKRGPTAHVQWPEALPPRGSTAVFGVFVTGLDKDRPERSLKQYAQTKSWRDWLLPRAVATDLLTPDVLQRVLVVGGIASATLVLSFFARLSVLKARSLAIRAHIESVEDRLRADKGLPPLARPGFLYRARTFTVDVFTIFAQGLTALEYTPKVTLGYLLEYFSDRGLGSLGRAPQPQGLVRRFLRFTLLYDRDNAENVLSNAKTLWYGAGVLGGIDMGIETVQLLLISPVFFPYVASFMGEKIHAQVSAQFSGTDAATSNLITSELMRGGSGYLLKGAFDYADKLVGYYLQLMRSEVEMQMRREGKNPQDERQANELTRRMRERIEPLLVSRGLPSASEKLFTAPSLMRGLTGRMGYTPDRGRLPPEASAGRRFILENERWGILNFVLKTALREARRLNQATPDATTQKAVEILEETKREYNFLGQMLRHPTQLREIWQKAKAVRTMLTTLTYLDDNGEFAGSALKFVQVWKDFATDPKAAALSARLFRQAFFAAYEAQPYYLRPKASQTAKYLPQALEEAERRLQQLGPEAEPYTEVDKKILAGEIVKERIAAIERRQRAETWTPATPKWSDFDLGMTNRQMRRLQDQALQAVARAAHVDMDELLDNDSLLTSEWGEQTYREAYRYAYTREVGIYTMPAKNSHLIPLVLQETNEKMDTLARSPTLQRFLQRFSPAEQVKVMAHYSAEAFVEKYVESTVSNSRVVSLTSPEQPGIFQRWRQLKIVMSPGVVGRAFTYTLRALESPWPNNSYGLGAHSWRHRNIPFLRDFSTAVRNRRQTLFGTMVASYAANYWVWQAKFTWPSYLLLTLNLTLLGQASYLLDRFMMNIDKPPYDSVKWKAFYGIIWAWISYPLLIPFFFLNPAFNEFFDNFVFGPMAQGWDQARELCLRFLSGN